MDVNRLIPKSIVPKEKEPKKKHLLYRNFKIYHTCILDIIQLAVLAAVYKEPRTLDSVLIKLTDLL